MKKIILITSHLFIMLLLSVVTENLSAQSLEDRILPHFDYKYWGDYNFETDISKIESQKWIGKNHIIDGWDFSLPKKMEPSEKSMLVTARTMTIKQKAKPVGKYNFEGNITCEKWVRWRDIEPIEGVYDWYFLRKSIEETQAAGYNVALRILTAAHSRQGNVDLGYAPEWLAKYDIPYLNFGNGGNLAIGGGSVCYDPAHPEFHKRYLKLIEEFGKSGIPEMLQAAYTGYASKSHGEEGIAPTGVNPDTLDHVKERLDAWAKVFKGMEHKIYMGGPCNHGFDLGFGVRRGFVEMYWYTIPDPIIGQNVDSDGYIYVDEEAPVIKSGAFNGEVNEEYEGTWATEKGKYRFGESTASFPYRYFMSMLRALQMRCTTLIVNGNLIPEMLPFISQELARTVEDTPDIWTFMCQTTLQANRFEGVNHEGYLLDSELTIGEQEQANGVEVKNFERWLYQRDAEGFITEPAVKIQHPIKMWMIQDGHHYDYIARRGAAIGFHADNRFDESGRSKAIKVSYFDDSKGEMMLKYIDSKGDMKSVKTKLLGDGNLRTATFIINDISLSSSGDDFDFTLHAASGAEQICVSMVRVVKI